MTLVKKVAGKRADLVEEAIVQLLEPLKKWVHTITADNGKEFANHENIAARLGTKFYFADPYSSWQRGLNENSNGLIRQYFKKGSSFVKTGDNEVQVVMDKLNRRPRKTLGFKTPSQIFFRHNRKVALLS